MIKYQPSKVEEKSRKKWKYKVDLSRPSDESQGKLGKKFYFLVEFTYPSGDLHMGHWFAFAVPDILARLKRMQGYTVFAPNGFDAFGLPAENAAIRRGIHPKDWTFSNIKRMKEQFSTMGAIYDWEHEVITCEPDFYKWNQWIFLKMYEKGLAYRGKILSNWCPKDQTVLANENVENGKCWRCGTEVVQKEVEQWFLKITEYAEKLLWKEQSIVSGQSTTSTTGLNLKVSDTRDTRTTRGTLEVDWPKSLKESQNNWIGKSEGIIIKFQIPQLRQGFAGRANTKFQIEVFTKFPETIFGVTYMVIAPEHPLVGQLATAEHKKDVEDYIKLSKKKSELERTSLEKQKTGVFTGSHVVNPVNDEKVPVWVADYVIATYGTGAVMGVPGSDLRDFEFAKKFDLPIVRVIGSSKNDQSEVLSDKDVLEEGWLVNSGQFNSLAVPEPAKEKIMDYLVEKGWGKRKVNYHLHDWSISRQRYWGTPIPIIYCDRCGVVPVPEKDLPVLLPYDVDFAPKGKPPLATAEEWVRVKCPNCGEEARRDVETLDTFFDSSWYFLRYLRHIGTNNKKDENLPFARDLAEIWLPVDVYFGGAEHTLGHTLYSRFFVKFLKDIGVLKIDEYAKKRVHHGVILGSDGQRMSKSHGNVVNPDDEVAKYGADAVRMYLAFLGPYDLVAPWDPGGIRGVYHFLERVWKLFDAVAGPVSSFHPASARSSRKSRVGQKDNVELRAVGSPPTAATRNVLTDEDKFWMNKTIKKVGEDIEGIKFNTAVSAMMEWLNYLSGKVHRSSLIVNREGSKVGKSPMNDTRLTIHEYEVFLRLLAPFAPHITEELWEMLHSSPSDVIASEAKQSKKKIATDSSSPRNDNVKWSIHSQPWPEYDERFVKAQTVTLVVQVNGKVRDSLPVEAGISQTEAEKLALASVKVQKFLNTKGPRKVVFVPGRLINLVV